MHTETTNPGWQAGARGIVDADRVPEHTATPTRAQRSVVPIAVTRIIARPVPWPSLKERPDRTGLRLRWDAVCEETGEVLVAGTEHPLPDAAHLLTMRGVSGEALVTMRHEGSSHDSFEPMPLRIPAAAGAKRAERKERLAAMSATHRPETAAEGAWVPGVPAAAQAAALGNPDAGGGR